MEKKEQKALKKILPSSNKLSFLSFITRAGSRYAVLLGIGIFMGAPLWGQPVSDIARSIQEQLAAIEADYYYTHLDTALHLYQQVADRAAQHQRWDLQVSTLLQMAWCADYHGHPDTLQYYLKQAKQQAVRHAPALDAQQSVRLMIPYTEGIFYYATEDYQQSVEAFSQLVSPHSPAFDTDSMLVFSTYSYIGQAYYENANYHQAAAYHQRAIQWLPRSTFQENIRDYHYYQALNYLYLGQCYLSDARYEKQEGAYDVAKQHFLVALNTLRKHLNDASYQNSLSSAYEQLAEWHRLQQNYDSALWYLDRALPFYSEENRQRIYYYIGRTYKDKGEYAAAQDYLQRSLRDAHQAVETATALGELGNVHVQQSQWDQALSFYQQALVRLAGDAEAHELYENPSFSPSDVRLELIDVLMAKAHALAAKSKVSSYDTLALRAAIDTYHRAVLAIDQMRQVFPSLAYKQFLSARAASLYEQAIQASLRAHTLGLTQKDFLAEAFYFSEKGKAATLLEAARTSEARSFAGIPAELLEQENELKRTLTYWENKLYQASDDAARQVLRNRAFETREAYASLINRLEKEYPNYYQLKYDTEVVGLPQLQASLPEKTTLLSFCYGDSALYAFAIRHDEVQWHITPMDSVFHRRLENVLRTISRYDYQQAGNLQVFRQFTHDAYQMYQTLVQPLTSLAGPTEQLIIIPDGLLGYLPFDVLLTEAPATTKIDYQSLPYLIKQLPISYEYSATLLTSPPATETPVPYSYLGFAPSYQEVPLAESREVRTTLDGQLLGLGQLRYNQEEIAFASQLFDGKTFTGEEATEATFKQYAGQSKLLHLSMHAYAHDKKDDLSGLIFTQQTDTTQEEEDGFLHINELYSLPLHAELAVLSACETGIGTLAPGEGIMSLGRAFKYAGCPNVTMSLWTADDQTTSQIIQRFFTHLQERLPKDRALRQAKLHYLDQARSAQAHPYYWAAFVQVGRSSSLSPDDTFSSWWWMAGGLVLAFLLSLLVRK